MPKAESGIHKIEEMAKKWLEALGNKAAEQSAKSKEKAEEKNHFSKEEKIRHPKRETEPFTGEKVILTRDQIIEKMTELARKSPSDISFVNATRFLAVNYGIDNTSDEFIEAMGLVRGDPEQNLQTLKRFYRTQGLSAKREHKKEVAQSKAEFDVANIERMANEIAAEEAMHEAEKQLSDEQVPGTRYVRPS